MTTNQKWAVGLAAGFVVVWMLLGLSVVLGGPERCVNQWGIGCESDGTVASDTCIAKPLLTIVWNGGHFVIPAKSAAGFCYPDAD